MLKTSPHPWSVQTSLSTICIRSPRGEVLATIPLSGEHAEGNAYLMAHAPELLECVIMFLRQTSVRAATYESDVGVARAVDYASEILQSIRQLEKFNGSDI